MNITATHRDKPMKDSDLERGKSLLTGIKSSKILKQKLLWIISIFKLNLLYNPTYALFTL
jgi:hypothetical protein